MSDADALPPAASLKERADTAASAPPAELGWATVQLPSRGVYYDGAIPDGKVQMRKMRSGELARLSAQGGSIMDRLEAMTRACTRLPNGFEFKNLLLTDSLYLTIALRMVTFGPEYTFNYRCGNCSAQERSEVNIQQELNEKVAAPDDSEPIEIHLPDCGKTVQCRLLRVHDFATLSRQVKQTKMRSMDADDPSYASRIAMSILEIDDEDVSTNILTRRTFVESLTATDTLLLEQTLDDRESGIETRIFPECGSCGYVNDMVLPLTGEFFRPRINRR